MTEKPYQNPVDNENQPDMPREERLRGLAEKFRQEKTLRAITELDEQSRFIEEVWQEDAPGMVNSYVDEYGALVAVKGEANVPSGERVWRLLFDEHEMSVAIPAEYDDRNDPQDWLYNSSITQRIYDTNGHDESSLPDDLQRLVGKFGGNLKIIHGDGSSGSYGWSLYAGKGHFFGIDELKNEIERPERERYEADMTEAYAIEGQAKHAAEEAFDKPRFATDRRRRQLAEVAYRQSVNEANHIINNT